MITFARFHLYPSFRNKYGDVVSCYVPEDLFDRICSLAPECVGKESPYFECNLPQDDARTKQILRLLSEAGYEGATSDVSNEDPMKFGFELFRQYEEKDFEASAFLQPRPIDRFSDSFGFTEDGRPKVDYKLSKSSKKKIGISCWWFILVKDSLRRDIEGAGFSDAIFQDTAIYHEQRDVPFEGDVPEPIWRLMSAVAMPPTTTRLVNGRGEPFTGDMTYGCLPDEGMYYPKELHYSRSDIKSIGPFDIAMTKERFGNGDKNSFPYVIVSQRFYQFCCKKRLNIEWVPVRIDD